MSIPTDVKPENVPRPLISRISIENFKGIGERVSVELKPITLLFGANSAGKSTILQALHYAREIFERHNLDADRTAAGGTFVDLGGFRNFVHNRSLMRTVVLEFELNLPDRFLPVYFTAGGEMPLPAYTVDDVIDRVDSASVTVHIGWDGWKNQVRVTRYAVSINGVPLAAIMAPPGRPGVELGEINFRHPVFLETQLFADFAEAAEQEGGSVHLEAWGIDHQADALPKWGRPLSLSMLVEPGTVENATGGMAAAAAGFMDAFTATISRLMVGPGELLRNWLVEFLYLGPIRETPARAYVRPHSPDPSRWASGIAAWDLLAAGTEPARLVGRVSEWMSAPERLATGYTVECRRFKRLDLADPLMRDLLSGRAFVEAEDARLRLDRIPTESDVVLVGERGSVELQPHDVGIGISQLVPVVVAALEGRGGLVMIEQPELHIHPRIQAALGDLFISAAIDGHETFLLETHSEHLMLRLLRRIRQTHDGDLPAGQPQISPDLISVLSIESVKGQVRVYPLRIDETGEFRDRWPTGFFEERAEELF